MSEIKRESMPMMRVGLLDRIAIASPFKLIPTLSKNDTIIESRRTCGNARIPTAGDQVRKVLHDFIPSLLAALLQCSSCVGAVATRVVEYLRFLVAFRISRFNCWAKRGHRQLKSDFGRSIKAPQHNPVL